MTKKFELFFARLKEAAGAKSDTDLWKYLDINKSTLSMWKSREKVDWDLIFTKFEHSDLNWIVRGKKFEDNNVIIDEPNPIRDKLINRQDEIIEMLKKEVAALKKRQANFDLQRVAENDPELTKKTNR